MICRLPQQQNSWKRPPIAVGKNLRKNPGKTNEKLRQEMYYSLTYHPWKNLDLQQILFLEPLLSTHSQDYLIILETFHILLQYKTQPNHSSSHGPHIFHCWRTSWGLWFTFEKLTTTLTLTTTNSMYSETGSRAHKTQILKVYKINK